MDADHPNLPGCALLLALYALAAAQRPVGHQHRRRNGGGRRLAAGRLRRQQGQDAEVCRPPPRPVPADAAQHEEGLLQPTEARPLQALLPRLRPPLRQLSDVLLRRHQAALRRQRRRPAVHAGRHPRLRVPPVRRARHEAPAVRRGVDRLGQVSPSDALRLQDPPEYQRAPVHRTVRTADQPLQREDLRHRLVLVSVRWDRDVAQPVPVADQVDVLAEPDEVHQTPAQSHGLVPARAGHPEEVRRELSPQRWDVHIADGS